MEPNEMMTLATHGVLLAALIRWLFDLDVGFGFAAAVGTLSVLASPWLSTAVGLSSSSMLPGPMIGAFLISIVLGIAQLLRSY